MCNFKNFVIILSLIFIPFLVSSQARDSVCVNDSGVKYWVTNTVGSTYQWTLTGGGTIASGQGTDTIVINWGSTPGIDTLKVVETNADLCVGDVVRLIIDRGAIPVANAGTDVAIGSCSGQSTQLDGSLSSGSAPLTYSWSPSSSLSNANIVNPIANPSSSITYTLSVTTSHGCTATDEVVITVDAAPVATVGADATIGNCVGQATSIDGTSSTGVGLAYSWSSNPSGFTSALATVSVSPTVTTSYRLVVEDDYGCTDTAYQIVNVAIAPIATATTSKDTIGNCALQSANISASSSVGVSLTYSWSSNPGTFSSTNANETVSPSATTTYTVVVTDDYNCTSTDDVIIVVDAAPIADAGTPADICVGGSINLNASASTGSNITYSWTSNPVGFTSSLANPLVSPTSNTTYTLVITDKNGCTSTDDVVITAISGSIVSAGTISPICEGSDAALSGSASNYSSILWSTAGDGTFANPTTLTPDYTPGANDISTKSVNLTITVQGNSPCPSAADTKILIINPKPVTSPIFHF